MAPFDILVIGKGPAGLLAAAATAERGLRVGVLGPQGRIRWPAQYGAWWDELEALGYPEMVEQVWPQTSVGSGEAQRRVLNRAYVRIDKERLLQSLIAHCENASVQWLDGIVTGVRHHAAESVVRCDTGREVRARVVIDASGHRPALLRQHDVYSQGFQTAVGFTFEPDPGSTRLPPEQAILMDWDDNHLPSEKQNGRVPSFLYAMPLKDGRVFAEETVLVGRPAVPFPVLDERLRVRLRALGIRPGRVVEREECWIPMGGALPRPQRVVGFGGAAGMVHPATGYLLASVLEAAPRLGATLAAELGSEGARPSNAARSAWDVLWSAERRNRYALFRFGMEAVLRFDAPRAQSFFRTFFSLPEPDWSGYLSNRLSAQELSSIMARLFVRASPAVRNTLIRAFAGREGLRSVPALLRGFAR